MKTTSKKAKQQFEMQRKKFNKDVDELSEVMRKATAFKLQHEEIDYSLLNYVLTVYDFTNVKDLNEALFSFYRHLYVHLATLQRDNESLKTLVAEQFNNMSDEDKERANTVLDKKTPFEMAHDFLKEISERAKRRSRAGIISYTKEDAKDMGIDIKG